MSTSVTLSDDAFTERFGNNAILVEKDSYEFYERLSTDEINQKITAFRCEDDITVFAVEHVAYKVKCIMAWRFCEVDKSELAELDNRCNELILDMQLRFHELVKPEANCLIYIVGGTIDTTVGEGRLLDRIRKAIHGYFIRPNLPVEIRENESWKHDCKYVTAKVEMDGKLTDCYHN